MNVLGLDPGLAGALALMREDGHLIDLVDMPTLVVTKSRREIDAAELVGLLEEWRAFHGEHRAIVERAMVMPKQGGSSGFKTGIGFGLLLGILAAQKIPHELTTPQAWQKALFGKIEPGTSKGRARQHASRLYPSADLGRRKSQDRADALCIALYGLERWRKAA